MPQTQYYFGQDVADRCAKIFSDLADRSHGNARTLERLKRNATDVRALINRARVEEPNSVHDIPVLAGMIQRTDESDAAALLALIDVFQVLTGAYGPYAVEFHHNDRPVAHAKPKPDRQGLEFLDNNGVELSHDDVVIKARRKTLDEIVSAMSVD
ncbi:hypothetical protein [Burkholderia gladioli]|uniref:hypothetical protein n=2 Tax=Burkholderia TaxID=32008 RepID=UPI00164097DA|nr:hypothetical protein [Burkholderia gladioli]